MGGPVIHHLLFVLDSLGAVGFKGPRHRHRPLSIGLGGGCRGVVDGFLEKLASLRALAFEI
jgi:hypothetical protein